MLQAEGVAAAMAEVVVKDFLVDNFAKRHTGRAACGTANERLENRAGDDAEGCTRAAG